MSRTAKRVILIVILSFSGIGLVLGFMAARSVFKVQKVPLTVSKLEARTRLQFPRSTRMIEGYREGFMDPSYFALLEFDAADTEAFLKSIRRKNDESTRMLFSRKDRFGISSEVPMFGSSKNPEWWNPDSVHKFIAVEIEEMGGMRGTYLLISMDDTTKRRVYVFAYSI